MNEKLKEAGFVRDGRDFVNETTKVTLTVTEAGGIVRKKGKSRKILLKDEDGVRSLFQAKAWIVENVLK